MIDVVEDRLNAWLSLLNGLVKIVEMRKDSQVQHAQTMQKCARIDDGVSYFSPDSEVYQLAKSISRLNVSYYTESSIQAKSEETHVISGLNVSLYLLF